MKTASPFQELSEEIELLKQNHLYRNLRVLDDIRETHAKLNGREVMLFCSNDYLGLSKHPLVIEAFQNAAKEFGVGSGASRLISGTSILASQLEGKIAQFKRKEKALIFTAGYLANLGTISALCQKGDLVIIDKLNHASIVDACKLSGASVRAYPHRDINYLEKILEQSKRFRRKLIVTDSVFSMDGDLAPLREIVSLKNRYDALLMIDEAHGTGVFGEEGRGAAEFCEVEDSVDISMGTLSKAIGTLGGFVAGDGKLIEYLINKSRTFIFATALPPAILAASLKSFDLIENDPSLRQTLWKRVEQLNQGLREIGAQIQETPSPIIPIVVGEEEKAKKLSEALFEEGFFIPAVRYPAVPKKKARLRMTVSSLHQEEDICNLLAAIRRNF